MALTTTSRHALHKVGLSHHATKVLHAEDPDWHAVLRSGAFTPRQVATLRDGDLTVAKLIAGGFTAHQARLILGE